MQADTLIEMDFKHIKVAVAKQFDRMSKHELFRTGVTKDALWDTYLASFPEGSNPIYKTRTEHDCQCCKQFVRAVGDVVAIIDGQVESIWDIDIDDLNYQAVALAMGDLARSHPITDTFLHYEKTAGTDKNLQDTLDGVKTWSHFFVNIPAKFVVAGKDIGTELNKARTAHQVLNRGLAELKADDLRVILELIAQNSLYRGEEHKFAVTTFLDLKHRYDQLPPADREAFVWLSSKTVPGSVSGFRNTSIGTLAVALSEGKELEDAVKAFEAMVAPANYKRPTALVTKAMIEKAKATITELGLGSALERRYATIEDITVNNVLFADRGARKSMGDVFDSLAANVPTNLKSMDKVEEVSIDKFISDILPQAKALELMVENRHTSNLVSLVAPADATALPLFKWANNFSWSYNGDVADSMKERVKKAGGNVTGDLCCRLAWDYTDDLDFHMKEPAGHTIYFGNRGTPSPSGGRLDVDANGGSGMMKEPVENIFYAHRERMQEGTYTLLVNNYSRRSDGTGFTVEVEFGGEVHSLSYQKALRTGEKIEVAQIHYTKAGGFKLQTSLQTSQTVRQVWGLSTQSFQKVSVVMMSPNHWDGQGVGNRHFFFMLADCHNEGQARGFFNEYLKSELDPHRKVIEMVGAKMKTEESERQLSGLGFSSTQRNSVLCKVTGALSRVIKIVF